MDPATLFRLLLNVPMIGTSQIAVLVVLCLANLILAVTAETLARSFDLVQIGNWSKTRLLPAVAVYVVAALVTWAMPFDPVLSRLRDVVFTTESLTLIALCLANLKDLGVPLPTSLAGFGKVGPTTPTPTQPALPTLVPLAALAALPRG
jgi:hypothetical protein